MSAHGTGSFRGTAATLLLLQELRQAAWDDTGAEARPTQGNRWHTVRFCCFPPAGRAAQSWVPPGPQALGTSSPWEGSSSLQRGTSEGSPGHVCDQTQRALQSICRAQRTGLK